MNLTRILSISSLCISSAACALVGYSKYTSSSAPVVIDVTDYDEVYNEGYDAGYEQGYHAALDQQTECEVPDHAKNEENASMMEQISWLLGR